MDVKISSWLGLRGFYVLRLVLKCFWPRQLVSFIGSLSSSGFIFPLRLISPLVSFPRSLSSFSFRLGYRFGICKAQIIEFNNLLAPGTLKYYPDKVDNLVYIVVLYLCALL